MTLRLTCLALDPGWQSLSSPCSRLQRISQPWWNDPLFSLLTVESLVTKSKCEFLCFCQPSTETQDQAFGKHFKPKSAQQMLYWPLLNTSTFCFLCECYIGESCDTRQYVLCWIRKKVDFHFPFKNFNHVTRFFEMYMQPKLTKKARGGA